MSTLTMRVLVCWFIFMLAVSLCIIEPRTILVIFGLLFATMLTAVFASVCSPWPDDPY